MGAYLGHVVNLPNDQFLAFGSDFQSVLDGIDKVGQADESSVRSIVHRLLMRVRLTRMDALVLFTVPDNPFVDVTEELIALRKNPGTGPTGDTLRSFGPTCKKCGALHFPDQECRVFQEFSARLQVGLFASTTTPGEAIIEVYKNGAETPTRFPNMVPVGDLDDLGAFGLLPFHHNEGRYLQDAPADMDLDGERLLLECEAVGVKIPVDPELEEDA